MNRIIIEEYEIISLSEVRWYTVRFANEEDCETNRFLTFYNTPEFAEDLKIVRAWIRNICRRGTDERLFRSERRVYAGPIFTSKLRIYCIVYDGIVILDGGRRKSSRFTHESPLAYKPFRLTEEIERKLRIKLEWGETVIDEFGMLEGELFVDI